MANITHGTAIEWFSDSEDSTIDARKTGEQSRDYYDNIQYTDQELAKYKSRNQPPVTKNRIKPKVDFLLGMERQSRTDPKAFPRNPEDIEGAQAATDSIRYVCDRNNFDQERSLVAENLFIEGTGGVEASVVQNKKGEFDINIDHLPWDRIFYDPHSRRSDFKDAKYFGYIRWMDFDDAEDEFPDKAELLEPILTATSTSETFDDSPRQRWTNTDRKRLRIARIWYIQDGDWYFATFTGSGWLEDPTISPWKDADGDTEPGLILQSTFVTRENERYGIVYPLLSIQDAINFRESKTLHLMSVRQTWGTKESGIDTEKVKKALSKADGHVELPAGRKFGEDFGIIPNGDMSQGQFQLLQEAKSEIDNIGAAAALSGKGGAASGRELIARQQGGKMELGPVFDNIRQWQHRVYNWIWMRIKQFWTEPKMLRITNDPKNAKFVGLNQPITVRDTLLEKGVDLTGAENDPRLDVVVGTKNNTAEIDVDIVVDDAPDTTTLVGEQFADLATFAAANPGSISGKVLMKASQLPNKEELLDEMEQTEKANAEGQQQQQEAAQQTLMLTLQQLSEEVKNLAAKTQNTQADTAGKMAEVENTQADTELKETEAIENMSQARENIAAAVDDEINAVVTRNAAAIVRPATIQQF